MIRTFTIITLSLFVSLGTITANEPAPHKEHDHKKHVQVQTNCPIRGGKVNKDVYVDYKGKRVYFCCPGCDKKFLANADELIKEMEAKGITLDKAPVEQTICPVSGDPIDKDIFVEHNGQKVYLCCKMCKGKFNKDPEAYMKKLAEQQKGHAAEGEGKKHDGHQMKQDAGHEHHNH